MAEKSLKFLYSSVCGRLILKIITKPSISVVFGKILNCRISKILIPHFIKKNRINMDDYINEDYKCFNDFFCRHIKPELRPIDFCSSHLIAPCDGLLSVYKINSNSVFSIKNSFYTISELLKNEALANEFCDGVCLIFRLCVNNYHRYNYIDNGIKGKNIHINGILHTVRPIAFNYSPVFLQNSREYTVIQTENFGKIIQMEVGAMLVGKIKNHHQEHRTARGEEKGTFLYGGSTVIVLIKKDVIKMNDYYNLNTNEEKPVVAGQWIASKKDA